MPDSLLTTIDNPFDPFDEWDEWYAYDESHGYHTCSYIARLAVTSDDLPDAMQDDDVDTAMAMIMKYDSTGIYTMVNRKENSSAQKEE